ncbi:hypothetical protein Q7P37_006670 [Cladosporium fusiforme]
MDERERCADQEIEGIKAWRILVPLALQIRLCGLVCTPEVGPVRVLGGVRPSIIVLGLGDKLEGKKPYQRLALADVIGHLFLDIRTEEKGVSEAPLGLVTSVDVVWFGRPGRQYREVGVRTFNKGNAFKFLMNLAIKAFSRTRLLTMWEPSNWRSDQPCENTVGALLHRRYKALIDGKMRGEAAKQHSAGWLDSLDFQNSARATAEVPSNCIINSISFQGGTYLTATVHSGGKFCDYIDGAEGATLRFYVNITNFSSLSVGKNVTPPPKKGHMYNRTPQSKKELRALFENEIAPTVTVRGIHEQKDTFLKKARSFAGVELPEGYDIPDGAFNSQRLTREAVDGCMKQSHVEFQNLRAARNTIAGFLGYTPFRKRLPSERSSKAGVEHFAHQTTFLAWLLEKKRVYGGGICADDMGLGKTHEILMTIIAMTDWNEATYPGRPHRPTLLVVPTLLISKWRKHLREQLFLSGNGGKEFTIIEISSQKIDQQYTSNKTAVRLSTEEAEFEDGYICRNGCKVFLVSDDYLRSIRPTNYEKLPEFDRVIFDEAHSLRNAMFSKLGEVTKLLAPDHDTMCEGWAFIGTPAYASLRDWIGLVYFLKRSHWSGLLLGLVLALIGLLGLLFRGGSRFSSDGEASFPASLATATGSDGGRRLGSGLLATTAALGRSFGGHGLGYWLCSVPAWRKRNAVADDVGKVAGGAQRLGQAFRIQDMAVARQDLEFSKVEQALYVNLHRNRAEADQDLEDQTRKNDHVTKHFKNIDEAMGPDEATFQHKAESAWPITTRS